MSPSGPCYELFDTGLLDTPCCGRSPLFDQDSDVQLEEGDSYGQGIILGLKIIVLQMCVTIVPLMIES